MGGKNFVAIFVLSILLTIVKSQEQECQCSNERPPSIPDYNCFKLAKWGKCGRSYLQGYCNASCQRCDCACEDKLPEDGGAACEQRKKWGACEKDWMIEGFYCAKTCGFCEESNIQAAAATLPGTTVITAAPFNPPTTLTTTPSTEIVPSGDYMSSLVPQFTPTSQTQIPTIAPQDALVPQPNTVSFPPRNPTLATSLINTPAQVPAPQALPIAPVAPVATPQQQQVPTTKLEGQQMNVAQVPSQGAAFELEEPAIVPSPITPISAPHTPVLPPAVAQAAPSEVLLRQTGAPTPVLPAQVSVPLTPTQGSVPLTPALSLPPVPITAPAPVVAPVSALATPNVVPTAVPTLVSVSNVPPMASPMTDPIIPTLPEITTTPLPDQLAVNAVTPAAMFTTVPDPVPALPNPALNTVATTAPAVMSISSVSPVAPALTAASPQIEEIPVVEVQQEVLPMTPLTNMFGADDYESVSQNYESIGGYTNIIQNAIASVAVAQQVADQQETQQVVPAAMVDPTAPLSATVPALTTPTNPIAAAVAAAQVVPSPAPLNLPAPSTTLPAAQTAATTTPGQCNTVYDIMSTDPDLTTSFQIWNRVRDMKAQGYDDPDIPFTVFVPVNAAWANYTMEQSTTIEDLLDDIPLLERLVTFHELPEPTLSTDWKHGLNLRSELRDIYNKRIIVLVGMPQGPDGEIRLLAESQALVIERDIQACAAVVMKLGDVMVPSGARLPPLQPSTVN